MKCINLIHSTVTFINVLIKTRNLFMLFRWITVCLVAKCPKYNQNVTPLKPKCYFYYHRYLHVTMKLSRIGHCNVYMPHFVKDCKKLKNGQRDMTLKSPNNGHTRVIMRIISEITI